MKAVVEIAKGHVVKGECKPYKEKVMADIHGAFAVRNTEVKPHPWVVSHIKTGLYVESYPTKKEAVGKASKASTIPNINTGLFAKEESVDKDALRKMKKLFGLECRVR